MFSLMANNNNAALAYLPSHNTPPALPRCSKQRLRRNLCVPLTEIITSIWPLSLCCLPDFESAFNNLPWISRTVSILCIRNHLFRNEILVISLLLPTFQWPSLTLKIQAKFISLLLLPFSAGAICYLLPQTPATKALSSPILLQGSWVVPTTWTLPTFLMPYICFFHSNIISLWPSTVIASKQSNWTLAALLIIL